MVKKLVTINDVKIAACSVFFYEIDKMARKNTRENPLIGESNFNIEKPPLWWYPYAAEYIFLNY